MSEFKKIKEEFNRNMEESKNKPLSEIIKMKPETELRLSQLFFLIWTIVGFTYLFAPELVKAYFHM